MIPDPRHFSDDPNRAAPATDGADLKRRLAFLKLREADAARLRELMPAFEAGAKEFVEAFYDHLIAFDETSKFLKDPALVARLKESQRQHFRSLLEADWDEPFVERSRGVGEAHADVGLEPQWFLGAYNLYIQHWIEHFSEGADDQIVKPLASVASVVRAVLLDIGLTLDAYFMRSTRDLRKALDMYWKANAELRQFAHLASHDLKTPLATAANLCDEALDEFGDQIPPGARELIEAARQQNFQMGRTIDELLASTISPRTVDDRCEASSQEAIDEAVERIRPELRERGIKLEVASHLPMVIADKVQLREAIYNLLSNAIKFMDKPLGQISIDAEMTDDQCVLCVADNGPGIPGDELEKIFVPFRRLAAHQHIAGSGVGLYFAKNLVEQQGGSIWVESELGEGSRFFVRLMQA